jgi:hypothetical protein
MQKIILTLVFERRRTEKEEVDGERAKENEKRKHSILDNFGPMRCILVAIINLPKQNYTLTHLSFIFVMNLFSHYLSPPEFIFFSSVLILPSFANTEEGSVANCVWIKKILTTLELE